MESPFLLLAEEHTPKIIFFMKTIPDQIQNSKQQIPNTEIYIISVLLFSDLSAACNVEQMGQ